MKNNTFNPLKGIIHIIAFFLLFLMEQIPLSILAINKKELGNDYQQYMVYAPFVSIALLIIVSIILFQVFKHAQKFKAIKFTRSTWTIIIVATLLVLMVNYVTAPMMKATNDNVKALELVGQNNMLMLVFFTIAVAPILEEILFRGIFMNWFFVDKPLVSTILSGLLFGLAHAPLGSNTDWIYFLSKVLLGIILASVYVRTKNIKANISVHFLNNFLAAIVGSL